MTEKKNVQRLRDIAKRYPDSYLACRDHGHSWQPLDASFLQDGNIERILGCVRCEARRVQRLDKQGYLLGGHYDYADGYAMVGIGRLDTDGKAIMRRTSVQRMMNNAPKK